MTNGEKLTKWLKESIWKEYKFAEHVGCSRSHLSALKKDMYKPNTALRKTIEAVTDGFVKADEWE